MECSCELPTTKFAYRKGLGTCAALLCMYHTLQSALESGQEARMVKIDFSAGFDWVNHRGILNKLCSVGIGSCVVYIDSVSIKPIIAILVDGCRSKLVNVVSWVTQSRVLCRCCSYCTLRTFFSFWKIS